MNLALKIALVERRVPAYITAQDANIPANKLSRFVMGITSPTEEEKARLSRVLGKTASELFPGNHNIGIKNA